MLGPALLVLAGGAVDMADLAVPWPPAIADYAEEASGWLLDGESLPPDYRIRLMQMPPAARLQAIVFLRRAGLLTADPWTLDDILKPAPGGPEDTQ